MNIKVGTIVTWLGWVTTVIAVTPSGLLVLANGYTAIKGDDDVYYFDNSNKFNVKIETMSYVTTKYSNDDAVLEMWRSLIPDRVNSTLLRVDGTDTFRWVERHKWNLTPRGKSFRLAELTS